MLHSHKNYSCHQKINLGRTINYFTTEVPNQNTVTPVNFIYGETTVRSVYKPNPRTTEGKCSQKNSFYLPITSTCECKPEMRAQQYKALVCQSHHEILIVLVELTQVA
jgi:hypothetical protein